MKNKHLQSLFIFMVLLSAKSLCQNIVFPDAKFQDFCRQYDQDSDNQVSQAEAALVTGVMDCSNLEIADLTGIRYFTGITVLTCSGNLLTQLPGQIGDLIALTQLNLDGNHFATLPDPFPLFSNLRSLSIQNNVLESLPLFQLESLTSLDCRYNNLTQLPSLNFVMALDTLACSYNQLTSLPDLPLDKLTALACNDNKLTELPDLSDLVALTYLYCHRNQLNSLPNMSFVTQLEELICLGNQFSTMPDISMLSNLTLVSFSSNKLTVLPDLSMLTNLTAISFSSNRLTSIQDLTPLIQLETILIANNFLTSLPAFGGSVTYLACENNWLDETSCPQLTGFVSGNYIQGNFFQQMFPVVIDWPELNWLGSRIGELNNPALWTYLLDCGQ